MIPWAPSALVNHLWQSTLFVFVIWLATLALRRNAARVRYWLWTGASVKFLVPLSMLVTLGERFEWRAAPAMARPAVSFVIEQVLAPAAVVGAIPASIPPSSPVWPSLLLALWCAGAAVVLVSWWRQWLPIRAALRRATPLRLALHYGAADLVVLSSPSMAEPGVIGIRRPRLLLPEGIVERLTPPCLAERSWQPAVYPDLRVVVHDDLEDHRRAGCVERADTLGDGDVDAIPVEAQSAVRTPSLQGCRGDFRPRLPRRGQGRRRSWRQRRHTTSRRGDRDVTATPSSSAC